MKILITGSKGFIGKNLISQLNNLGFSDIIEIDTNSTIQDLEMALSSSEFIFHLAGVNRPQNIEEYWKGNFEYTKFICDYLINNKKSIPIVFSSSIQAELDNPYGKSKKAAEEILLQYSEQANAKVFIYRLPNVFGKWSRPNYNSAIATFCYNIARNLPIRIDDPEKVLNLVYIDDVVDEFIQTMKNFENLESGYHKVKIEYKIKISQIVEKLYTFKNIRESLLMPDLKDSFDKKLFATFISYLPEDNLNYELEMKQDNRGWLSEFIKSENFGQIFVSKTKPGITRGNHWHHTKVEKFLVIYGEALIKLRKIDSDEVIEYKVSGDKLQVIDIPPGYTHSITNIGQSDLITIFWASEIFNPDKPDTYYLEV